MFPSSSLSSQQLLWSFYNIHNDTTSPTDSTESNTTPNNGFDASVVMVLSVSVGINFIMRCVLSCSTFVSRELNQNENDNNNGNISAAGLANKGVKKAALKTFPIVSYKADLNIPSLDTECVICIFEFVPGERVRLLPKCIHGFHVRCIDKLLNYG